MLKSLIILSLICTMIFGQGISYRIEAMGKDMAGIISDIETDLLRNPAHIFDGDFVQLQRSYTTYTTYQFTRTGPIYSGLLVKNPFGVLIEGFAEYSKRQDAPHKYSMISNYFFQSRIMGGLKLSKKPFGLEIGTEIKKVKAASEYAWTNYIQYNESNDYYELNRLKLGCILGTDALHEIMLAGSLIKIKFRDIAEALQRFETSDSMNLKFIPRVTYLYSNRLNNKNKYFHLLIDCGQPNTIEEIQFPSNTFLSEIDNELTGKISVGWEDFLHQKVLIGYGSMYKTDIVLTDSLTTYTHNLILPFAVEYKPTNYIFLRAGTSSYLQLKDEYGNIYRNQDFSNGFSYSLGIGLKFKKFSSDFVIPSSSVLYINNWKIRVCYEF